LIGEGLLFGVMSPLGPKAKCRHASAMSAHWGIADVMCSPQAWKAASQINMLMK
jgi:hypothetical protein